MPRGRRIRGTGATVELFPFLAVLACVLGALTLIVIGVTTSTLGETRAISIVGRERGDRIVAKTPVVIEVTRGAVILHPEQRVVPTDRLLSADSPLRTLLDEVSRRRASTYIIAAVRPDGFATFATVRDAVERRGLDLGFEPVDAGWRLRLRTKR